MEPLKPHEYQEKAVEQILVDKHTLVIAPVGSGKTLVSVEAMLRAKSQINLIVAPLNTFTGWRKTFSRQSGGEAVLRFIDSRKAGKLAIGDLMRGVPGYYFIGVERFRTMSWKDFHLDFIVFDETHRGANRKSSTHRAYKSAIKTEYVVAMSATPFGNKVEGAWAIAKGIWTECFDNSFWRWASEYLKEEFDPYAYKKFAGEKTPGKILADMPSVVMMPSVYNEVPAVHEVEVELNPAQRKVYKELYENAITFLDENPLIAELPSIKYIRLMETTLATPSVEDYFDEATGDVKQRTYFKPDAKSSKADAVEEILADLQVERPEPVLILTHSRKFATYLTQRLQSKKIEARQFVGGMPPEERLWKIQNFGKEFSVMVATISTIGEGVDGIQDVCHNEIWCSVSDNMLLNTQAKGRLSRQGQEHTVNRYVLKAVGTIEVESQEPRIQSNMHQLEESYNG